MFLSLFLSFMYTTTLEMRALRRIRCYIYEVLFANTFRMNLSQSFPATAAARISLFIPFSLPPRNRRCATAARNRYNIALLYTPAFTCRAAAKRYLPLHTTDFFSPSPFIPVNDRIRWKQLAHRK